MKDLQILDYINDYNDKVKEVISIFHWKLRNNNSPLVAHRIGSLPKEGKISNENTLLEYNFHGKGCRARLNDTIVDFDFERPNHEYEGVDKFHFIRYLKDNGLVKMNKREAKQNILDIVERLIVIGYLIKNENDLKSYHFIVANQ